MAVGLPFSDGFESNDFSAWDGTIISGDCALFTENVNPHHGTFNAHADFDRVGFGNAHCYVDLSSAQSNLFGRYEFYLAGAVTTAYYKMIYFRSGGGGTDQAYISYIDDAGTKKLQLWAFGGANIKSGDVGDLSGAYHCLELRADTAYGYQVWLDSVLKIDYTTSKPNANMDRAIMGGTANQEPDLDFDCCAIDSSRINCEAVGVSIPVAMHHYNHHITKIIRG